MLAKARSHKTPPKLLHIAAGFLGPYSSSRHQKTHVWKAAPQPEEQCSSFFALLEVVLAIVDSVAEKLLEHKHTWDVYTGRFFRPPPRPAGKPIG